MVVRVGGTQINACVTDPAISSLDWRESERGGGSDLNLSLVGLPEALVCVCSCGGQMFDTSKHRGPVIDVFRFAESSQTDGSQFDFRKFASRWRRESKEGRLYPVVKRALDVSFVLFSLPFLLPFCVLVAGLIKLDSPGPVFFRQTRVGYNGRHFEMLKFRSMVANASQLKEGLMHLNEHGGHDFKISKDPRTTRFGRLLRRTSMDELPQLWNVLVGDMSLIGPRACSIPLGKYEPEQAVRLTVPAGIAGLAQIFARDEDFDTRCHYDAWYVKNRTLMLDLLLLLSTIGLVLMRPNGK